MELKTVMTSSGTRIGYREDGESGAPLVQIHGLGTGHQNFDLLTPCLARDLHVYDVNLPGYNDSDELATERTIDSFADSVASFIRGLALEPIAVHGASMGGTVAISLAARYPELVDRLVVSIAFGRADRAGRVMRETWRVAAENGGATALAQLTSQQGFARAFWDRPAAMATQRSFVEAMETTTPAEFLRDLDVMDGLDVSELAGAIAAPTLLIGAAEDQMTPVDVAPSGVGMRDLASIIPHARLVVIENAGHFLWFEQVEAGSKEVVDFVLAPDAAAHLASLG